MPRLSCTVTLKVDGPPVMPPGFPVMVPVVAPSVNPLGSDPELTVQLLYGAYPLAADSVTE